MIVEAAAAAGGAWALRRLAHHTILRGLRAPRVPHSQGPDDQAFDRDRVREVRIPGPRGRQLFGWLVSPPQAAARPAAAVLVMHGWSANAATVWPIVPPLHAAGFAVLLIDARCHGRSDDEAFTSMPRFAEDIAAGLTWLRGFSLWLGVSLLLIGAGVAVVSALQFRTVVRGFGEMEIPRGYWTNLGVWLNFVLAVVALALAVHFVFST